MPDIETYRALLPALATTNGMLIGISTPYRRIGLLYQKHRDHFGVDDPDVLVVAGDALRFNPTLDSSIIERARASDPEAARSEWDAEFRFDVGAFLDDPTIEASVDYSRPLELPPRAHISYKAFVDASGGRHDHYAIAIGHKRDDRYIVDVCRGVAPPFDPQAVTEQFAALLRDYRITSVAGDNYSAAWVQDAWSKCGLRYTCSELPKSQIYLECLPLFTRGLVSLPDHKRLLRELRLLERRTHRSGKDTVDHGARGNDDYSNATCGVLRDLSARMSYMEALARWGEDDLDPGREAATEARNEQYRREFAARIYALSGGQLWPR